MPKDTTFIALGELGNCLLPKEVSDKYPDQGKQATLVFNPADATIPDDHKLKIEKSIPVGPQLYVTLLFWGVANYLNGEKKQIGFQISVLKRNPLREYADQYAREGMVVTRNISPHRWEFIEVTKSMFIERDDIEYAKKVMRETIDNVLLPECEAIVLRQLQDHYRKAQKGMVQQPLWFLEKRKIIMGKGGLT